MLLLALALAPGFAIIFYFYLKDEFDREPFKNLLISFGLGILSTIPAALIQIYFESELQHRLRPDSPLFYALYAFLVVGFGEELCKFVMLRSYAYRKIAFNEPFDGIVYSVMVSMGFATLENVFYVMEGGMSTALVRMFVSVPAHACFGVIMGYHVGLAKFDPPNGVKHLATGLIQAALFHGAFDFFLFLQKSPVVVEFVSEGSLFVCALILLLLAIRLSRKSIRLHHELSRQNFERNNNQING